MKKQIEFKAKIATFILASTILQTASIGACFASNGDFKQGVINNSSTFGKHYYQYEGEFTNYSTDKTIYEVPATTSTINETSAIKADSTMLDIKVIGTTKIGMPTVKYAGPTMPDTTVIEQSVVSPIIAKYAGPTMPDTTVIEQSVVSPVIAKYAGPTMPDTTVIEQSVVSPIIAKYAGPIAN